MADEPPKTSPVFTRKPPPGQGAMDFANCLNLLVAITPSPRARRLDWTDEGFFITIVDSKLMIYRPDDKQYHPLTVSVGDIIGKDWVIINEARS